MALTVGQRKMVELNKGKKVNVQHNIGGTEELIIHDGTIFQGVFRYVMHTAKNPRTKFENSENMQYELHHWVSKGYYFIDPLKIIL